MIAWDLALGCWPFKMVFPKSAFNLQGNKAGVQKNPGRKDAGCVASEMDHEPQGTEGCPKHWLKALQEVRNWGGDSKATSWSRTDERNNRFSGRITGSSRTHWTECQKCWKLPGRHKRILRPHET